MHDKVKSTPEKSEAGLVSILKSIQLNFYNELKEASAGKKTSLPFILHTLSTTPVVPENEIFQVMVIGGSVYKQALAEKRNGVVTFSKRREEKLPVFQTKEDLFAMVEQHLNPDTRVVALNFAYPLTPVFDKGVLDGILQTATKEHKFHGLINKRVGYELEQYFWKKRGKKIVFVVANDTVCLLLSGKSAASWEKLACGIIGTGINFAFFTSQTELVNLESGNFDKFTLSDEAREIDRASSQRGKGVFEKETAGCYLYQHFNSIIKKQKLSHSPLKSTLELKNLAIQENGPINQLAKELIRRSAGLIAAQIAGITLFKKSDMTFVMEGSMFWDGEIYDEYVEDFVKQLIPERKVIYTYVPESYFLGAARLVC